MMKSNDTRFKLKKTGHSWQVEVAQPLDFDRGQKIYYLNVTAEDKGPPSLHSSVLVEVVVININDNEPYFISSPYTFSIPEDIETKVLIGRVMAEDVDHDKLTFSVTGSDFKVDNVTGNLYTNAVFVNKLNSLYFRVSVFDGKHTTTSNVTVHIEDVNNNVPNFLNSSYQFNVVENVNNTQIGKVQAKDSDRGNNSKIQYKLLSSEWDHNLNVDIQTGAISVSGSLDREQLDSTHGKIYFVVMAIDQGTPSLTGTSEVIVEVMDVNDNCPKFPGDGRKYTYIITELTKPVNFHTAEAIDKDSDVSNNKIEYSLTSGGSYFMIHQNGSLSAKHNLKMENTTNGKFKIVINAKNSKFCGHISDASQEVEVVLEDVNDHFPIMAKKIFSINLPESFLTGSSIMNKQRIKATDADTDKRYNTVTYWITGGNNNSTFVIYHYTGDIILAKQLDYDDGGQRSYTLEVSAIDCLDSVDGHCNHSDTATVKIGVADINDNKPTFTKDVYRCTVSENSTVPIAGCNLIVTDLDTGINGQYDVSVKNDTRFQIKRTGSLWQVVVVKALDFDREQKIYYLNVTAEDKGTPSLQSSVLVEVVVTNINDNEPYFISAPYTFTIPEDIETNVLIGRVMADDVDHDKLTFSVTGSDFKVDNVTGNLYTNAVFVNKLNSLYFHVSVFDGRHTTTTNVTVHIEDVNNNVPHFLNSSYQFNVVENVNNTQIGKVLATDSDRGNNSEIQYKLLSSEWDHNLKVNIQTGAISVSGSLDREQLDSTHGKIYVVVMAIDQGTPSLTGTTEVIVEVLDANDNCPKFPGDDRTYTYLLTELTKPVNFHTADAKDKDSDISNNKIVYSLASGGSYFLMHQNGSLSAKHNLKMENTTNGKFKIVLNAKNSKPCGHISHASQEVEVVLEDVNDHSPIMTKKIFSVNLPESFYTGSSIMNKDRIKATDADTDKRYNTVTYWITGGNNNGTFVIDHYTGDIILAKELDYDDGGKKSYKLELCSC
ncbi:fat-like cadherin-related tumor suppressor homolog [Mytilus trossulus]|uniref:fat-like cadherin-related tumor suppressor homolog n=1 Tax=Mytilus trossulus TaxID=6551 RepID=UPI003006BE56